MNSTIYIGRAGQQQGPFTIEEINAKVAQGEIGGSDMAWTQGWAGWQPVSALMGIVLPPHAPGPGVPPPMPPPSVTGAPKDSVRRDIATLDVSPLWRERFQLIEQIGWSEGILKNYWNFKSLPKSDRAKVSFSIMGFLFGPFYYFAKGMWAKGGIILVASFILALPGLLPAVAVAAYCGVYANYDFYLFKVRGRNLW